MNTFILLSLGFVVGYIVKGVRDELQLRKDIEEAEQDAEQSKKAPQEFVAYIKQDNDMYYLYDVAIDMFLAQGKTSDEIANKLADRFPDVRVFIANGDKK